MLRLALASLLLHSVLSPSDGFSLVPLRGKWQQTVHGYIGAKCLRQSPGIMMLSGGLHGPGSQREDKNFPEDDSPHPTSATDDGETRKVSERDLVRNAFRNSWSKRFSGTGKPFVPVDKKSVMEREGCPPLLKEIVADFADTEDEMRNVRARKLMNEHSLELAIRDERYKDAIVLRDEIKKLVRKDPLCVLADLRKQTEEAGARGDLTNAANLRACSIEVEKFLKQYQLAGKWRGHYGRNGWETVEVHYENNMLIATKKTGTDVSAGEISFRADVSGAGVLRPVGNEPQSTAEKMRGILESHLDGIVAFKGEGQIAVPGTKLRQMVPGQLLVFPDGCFGFLWIPLGSIVMFQYLGDSADDDMDFPKEDSPVQHDKPQAL